MLMYLFRTFTLAVGLLSLHASTAPAAWAQSCGKDMDCPGNLLCEQGRCVDDSDQYPAQLDGASSPATVPTPVASHLICRENETLRDGECIATSNYGGGLLAADGLALLAVGIGIATEAPAPIVIGMGGYVLASPVIHWAHGNGWSGLGSLGLHAAGLWGGVVGYMSVMESYYVEESYYDANGYVYPEEAHYKSGWEVPSILTFIAIAGLVGTGLDYLLLNHTTESPRPATRAGFAAIPTQGGVLTVIQGMF